jgi:RimJ/RimL family protein N-acetyltransferase
MADQKGPNIVIEKVNPKRARAVHDAFVETGEELFATGIIPKPNFSIREVENSIKTFLELWDKDDTYMFDVIDGTIDQFVGKTILSQVNRRYQMATLSYWVRTSRVGEGIATKAARLATQYGFEKLGFQRIEIVVSIENAPSLRVAEKIGAVREGLLRNRLRLHGFPYDVYMYSLIPEDYGIYNSA